MSLVLNHRSFLARSNDSTITNLEKRAYTTKILQFGQAIANLEKKAYSTIIYRKAKRFAICHSDRAVRLGMTALSSQGRPSLNQQNPSKW
jgi:hypothetical protein